MPTILRGFTIRVHRVGNPVYVDEKQHTWAEKGSLPQAWDRLKQDPTIDQADLYTSAQRRVRATKRRYVDRYSREG